MFLYLKWKNIMKYKSINNKKENNYNNINSTGFDLFSSIICSIVIIFSSLIFYTLIYYKKKLSIIDLLTIAKYIFLTFIFSLFLFFSIHKQIYDVDENYNYCTSTISCFYISLLNCLQFSINLVQYKDIRNPCNVIKYMFNNNINNIISYFFINILISLIITIFPYFFQDKINNIYDFFFTISENDYFNISISKNKLLSPFMIINFFVLLYLYFQIKLFYLNLKEKSLLHLKYTNLCLLLTNILYLIFAIILLFMPLLSNDTNISKII